MKGVQATLQNPAVAPDIANDPVAAYLSQNAAGGSTATQNISTVAKKVRAALDAQAKAATAAGKELVFDPGPQDRPAGGHRFVRQPLAGGDLAQPGQLVLASRRALPPSSYWDSRSRASILAALNQSQTSGDPSQLSLGILNAYSSMSSEERQAVNWTPGFRDNAIASYKSTRQILSMLRGG